MKISILSDLHFGYTPNTELENDSFDNAEEAVEKALDSDLIILGGDIFDMRAPRTHTWAKALHILSKPLLKDNPSIRLVQTDKQLKDISQRTLDHIPVVSIAGNHERLSKGEFNTIEALENAGLAIHLHLNTVVFEKDGIKVAIHGMSSVPERYAKEVLDKWNPQPVQDAINILVMHQSIEPFIYSPLEPPSISISNLPKGFDIIVDGHLHGHGMEKIDGKTTLMMPGSTVITQFERNEAVTPKVIGRITIDNGLSLEFIPLETNRKFYYEELEIEQSSLTMREQVERKLAQILAQNNHVKKPVVRLRLKGTEFNILDQDMRNIESKFSDKAIMILVKDLESQELSEKRELLKNLREQKLSIEELGLNLLKKNLDELGIENFDYDTMFHLLSDDQVESALNILMGEQSTLQGFR